MQRGILHFIYAGYYQSAGNHFAITEPNSALYWDQVTQAVQHRKHNQTLNLLLYHLLLIPRVGLPEDLCFLYRLMLNKDVLGHSAQQ